MIFDREIALMLSEKRFISVPCKKCGGEERYTSNGNCVPCQRNANKSWTRRNESYHKKLQHDWHARNADKVRERKKKNYCPIKNYKRDTKWKQNNPASYKASIDKQTERRKPYLPFVLSLRRVRLKASMENKPQSLKGFDRSEMDKIIALKIHGCVYCGTSEKLCLDHKVPVSRGGKHAVDNFQWLCRSHNARKRDRTDEEFRQWCAEREIPLLPPCYSTFC